MISIIVAATPSGIIGRDNRLPWRLSADLKRFKSLTAGRAVLMGRKTFESIGRPLPGRRNIILSRDAAYRPAGCEVAGSIDAALALLDPAEECFVIGGESLYRSFWRRADRLYLTLVHAETGGDTRVPPVDPAEWRVTRSETFPADADNQHPYSFVDHERVTDEA
ncbi:MAG: dihydrofolate reductase [Odoribacteraceae bacterium]|jgi:dihydrofolate reductase|nr:dihydrofolate reductase [Odoribacteraceae bacterium]